MNIRNLTKLVLMFAIAGIGFTSAKAQNVTIPDAGFVTWLTANYPSCMSGNQMDTTCAAIVNETAITFSFTSATNITGIAYFDNLATFYCSDNSQLTSIAALPHAVKNVTIENNNAVTSVTPLPLGVITFTCISNQLLTTLTNLPNSIKQFDCYDGSFTSLPTLPTSLRNLQCYDGVLTSLPAFPDTLTYLNCQHNQLTSLPSFPDSMHTIICGDNNLTGLPVLPPNLNSLECSNNNIECLPILPVSLANLGFVSNPITCLPNYVPAAPNWMPLCVPNDLTNNPHGCDAITTAINSEKSTPLSVYTNANGQFILNSNEKINTIYVYNSLGELITTVNNSLIVDLGNKPIGMYFITTNKGEQIKVVKK